MKNTDCRSPEILLSLLCNKQTFSLIELVQVHSGDLISSEDISDNSTVMKKVKIF